MMTMGGGGFGTVNMEGGSQYSDNRQDDGSFYCNINLEGAGFVHGHHLDAHLGAHHVDYSAGQGFGQVPLGNSTPTVSVANGSWGFGPSAASLVGAEELAAAGRLPMGPRAARPLVAAISPLEELWRTHPHLAFTNQDFERLRVAATMTTTNAWRSRATAGLRTGPVRKRTARRQSGVKSKERTRGRGQRQKRAQTFTLTGRTVSRVFDGQISTSYRCSDGVVRILSGEALEAAKARTVAAAAAAASAAAISTMAAWDKAEEGAGTAGSLEEAPTAGHGMMAEG